MSEQPILTDYIKKESPDFYSLRSRHCVLCIMLSKSDGTFYSRNCRSIFFLRRISSNSEFILLQMRERKREKARNKDRERMHS